MGKGVFKVNGGFDGLGGCEAGLWEIFIIELA
jgi:hypothetical protein